MPSPRRFPFFFRSDYRIVDDAESRDTLKPVNPNSSLARRFFPDYRMAFFIVSGLYVLSMSLALAIISHPELLRKKMVSSSIPESELTSIPEIPRDQTVVFNEVKDFGIQGDDAWRKLVPLGRGFIELPVEVPLEDGGVEVKSQYFCISMFHQLHCIAGLKAIFENMSDKDNAVSHKNHKHLAHCFDYLRQGVMCAGDMTLEPAVQEKHGKRKSVNGYNVAHQCRNYQTIYDFAEQHRYINSTGIL